MTKNEHKCQEFRKGIFSQKKKAPAATPHIHGEDLGLYLYIYIYIYICIYTLLILVMYVYTYSLLVSY